jgi:hypothetical protein
MFGTVNRKCIITTYWKLVNGYFQFFVTGLIWKTFSTIFPENFFYYFSRKLFLSFFQSQLLDLENIFTSNNISDYIILNYIILNYIICFYIISNYNMYFYIICFYIISNYNMYFYIICFYIICFYIMFSPILIYANMYFTQQYILS